MGRSVLIGPSGSSLGESIARNRSQSVDDVALGDSSVDSGLASGWADESGVVGWARSALISAGARVPAVCAWAMFPSANNHAHAIPLASAEGIHRLYLLGGDQSKPRQAQSPLRKRPHIPSVVTGKNLSESV